MLTQFTETTIWVTPEIAYRQEPALLSRAPQRLGVVRRNNLQAVNLIKMLVDRGAAENFMDNKLIPEAEPLMLDYTVLDIPKKIATAGQ